MSKFDIDGHFSTVRILFLIMFQVNRTLNEQAIWLAKEIDSFDLSILTWKSKELEQLVSIPRYQERVFLLTTQLDTYFAKSKKQMPSEVGEWRTKMESF